MSAAASASAGASGARGGSAGSSAPTRHVKLVMCGNTSVGKSCLVTQFVRGEYHEFQEPTIGAAFLTQTLSLEDPASSEITSVIKFEIWDTAGQERYRSLAPMYYRGAAAAVVVFDVTSAESFAGAKSWVKELQRRGDANCVIALAANKVDADNRAVSKEEAQAFADENALLFFETSAKTGQNVHDMFRAIAKRLPKTPLAADASAGGGAGGSSGVNLAQPPAGAGGDGRGGVGCCS